MQDVLDKHYKRLAKDYDQFLYYSPDFVRTLTQKMVEKLQLKPDDTLADIGGGTGMYRSSRCRSTTRCCASIPTRRCWRRSPPMRR